MSNKLTTNLIIFYLLVSKDVIAHKVSLAITRACSCALPNSTRTSSSKINARKTPNTSLKTAELASDSSGFKWSKIPASNIFCLK